MVYRERLDAPLATFLPNARDGARVADLVRGRGRRRGRGRGTGRGRGRGRVLNRSLTHAVITPLGCTIVTVAVVPPSCGSQG